MAHYAFLDENNVVTEVIVGVDETELIEGLDPEIWYGNFRGQVCKRTSYNTIRGIHYNQIVDKDGNTELVLSGKPQFRKNYAGIGFIYDEAKDAFIAPKPFDSWILNEETAQWKAPVSYPTDDKFYQWSENDLMWVEIVPATEEELTTEQEPTDV